jgi:hypothetical protein
MGQKDSTYLLSRRIDIIGVFLHSSGHRCFIAPLGSLLLDGDGLVVSLATTRANIGARILFLTQNSIMQQQTGTMGDELPKTSQLVPKWDKIAFAHLASRLANSLQILESLKALNSISSSESRR